MSIKCVTLSRKYVSSPIYKITNKIKKITKQVLKNMSVRHENMYNYHDV